MGTHQSPLRVRMKDLHSHGMEPWRMWPIVLEEGLCTQRHKFMSMIYRMRRERDLPAWTPKRPPKVDRRVYEVLHREAAGLGMSYPELVSKILTICSKEPNLIMNILDGD